MVISQGRVVVDHGKVGFPPSHLSYSPSCWHRWRLSEAVDAISLASHSLRLSTHVFSRETRCGYPRLLRESLTLVLSYSYPPSSRQTLVEINNEIVL